jgi:hypothetical protein
MRGDKGVNQGAMDCCHLTQLKTLELKTCRVVSALMNSSTSFFVETAVKPWLDYVTSSGGFLICKYVHVNRDKEMG